MGTTKRGGTGHQFVELGRYLREVRAGQYWRLENLKSFAANCRRSQTSGPKRSRSMLKRQTKTWYLFLSARLPGV